MPGYEFRLPSYPSTAFPSLTTAHTGSIARDRTIGGIRMYTGTSTNWTHLGGGEVYVDDPVFGAVGDGVTDDTTAIQAAIDVLTPGIGGVVRFQQRSYAISNQITVRSRVRLVGVGQQQGSQLIANSSFPALTPMVRLGDGTGNSFGCRCENLELFANENADYGIYSTDINESSGARNVLIRNYRLRGVFLDGSGATKPDNFLFDQVTCGFGATATAPYGFYFDTVRNGGQLRRCTVVRNTGAVMGTAGVYLTTADTGGHSVHMFGLNLESVTDGVFFDTNSGGTLINGTLLTAGTSLVRINSSFPVCFLNLVRGVGTNIVRNDTLSQNLTTLRLASYVAAASAEGYQVIADVGAIATSGNVVAISQPMWMVKSLSTSGSASQARMELRDGNEDGWQLLFAANATNNPLQFRPVIGGVLQSAVFSLDDLGGATLIDGGNIVLGTTSGSKIGTSTAQKLAFYNKTPVIQPAAISSAAGGATVDAEARTAVNTALDRLRDLGLIST